jgi:hypothetical protein
MWTIALDQLECHWAAAGSGVFDESDACEDEKDESILVNTQDKATTESFDEVEASRRAQERYEGVV